MADQQRGVERAADIQQAGAEDDGLAEPDRRQAGDCDVLHRHSFAGECGPSSSIGGLSGPSVFLREGPADVVVKDDIKDEVQDENKDKIKEEVKYKMKDETNGQRGCVHGRRRRDGDAVFATQYSIINSIIFDKLNLCS